MGTQVMCGEQWLGLMVGNSRLHWGWFEGERLKKRWESNPLTRPIMTQKGEEIPSDLRPLLEQELPLYLASVVASQTQFCLDYPYIREIKLSDIPLQGLYPTLGIDRALGVLGAGTVYGFPCLVIDGGTALTFTGVNGEKTLEGGAILPGLRLQFEALGTKTAALPAVELPPELPERWAKDTPRAIASGVVYTVLAGVKGFIEAWRVKFPQSAVVFTGGDSRVLFRYLQGECPSLVTGVRRDEEVIFWGIRSIVGKEGGISQSETLQTQRRR